MFRKLATDDQALVWKMTHKDRASISEFNIGTKSGDGGYSARRVAHNYFPDRSVLGEKPILAKHGWAQLCGAFCAE